MTSLINATANGPGQAPARGSRNENAYDVGPRPVCLIIGNHDRQNYSLTQSCSSLEWDFHQMGFRVEKMNDSNYVYAGINQSVFGSCSFLFIVITGCVSTKRYNNCGPFRPPARTLMEVCGSRLASSVPMISVIDRTKNAHEVNQGDLTRSNTVLILPTQFSTYLERLRLGILETNGRQSLYNLHLQIAEKDSSRSVSPPPIQPSYGTEFWSTMNKRVFFRDPDYGLQHLLLPNPMMAQQNSQPNLLAFIFYSDHNNKASSFKLADSLTIIGFDVTVLCFYSYNFLLDCLKINQQLINNASIFFLVVACHGSSGCVFGSDTSGGTITGIIELCDLLLKDEISLVFIVEACQVINTAARVKLARKNSAILMSTVLGELSYCGYYLEAFAAEIIESKENVSLYDLHTRAAYRLSKNIYPFHQTPEFRSTMKQKILLVHPRQDTLYRVSQSSAQSYTSSLP